MTLGNKIRALRIERGLSQDELARACGYTSRSSINKIELGKADPPQRKILLIANALGVPPASLLIENNPQSDSRPVPQAPKTKQARILAGIADIMPENERDFLLGMVEHMYEKYAAEYERMEKKHEGSDP